MINRKILTPLLFFVLFNVVVKAQPQQGQLAAEIALPSVTGDTIRLSSLKGKVVLLDFWASWCRPCRTANKGFNKLYSKFKEKGFEIFSVSLDDNKENWLKAIKHDKISWLQVNDNGGWEAPTVFNWRIDAIPTNYLIDKDGRLIAMDLEGKNLEKALKDILED